MFESMIKKVDMCVDWNSDNKNIKKKNKNYYLDKGLVMILMKKIKYMNKRILDDRYTIEGYTRWQYQMMATE